MGPPTVVVTDHDFGDLEIERKVLNGVADVVDLSDGNNLEMDELKNSAFVDSAFVAGVRGSVGLTLNNRQWTQVN